MAQETALEVIALVSRNSERGVDASRCAPREGEALVMRTGSDELGGGMEPDVLVDGMLGTHETIDERDEDRIDVGAGRRENGVAVADEGREEAIASGEALADQGFGDGIGLVKMVEVPDDAQEIASVDPVGERPGGTLAGKDRDRVDDGVAWIAGNGVAEVAFGIEQAESCEGVVEERADDGVLAGRPRLARELLLAHALT